MITTINLAQDSSPLSSYLSNSLLDKIETTLEKGEKCLLYLNKRGAYSSMICQDCQYLFECPNCDVSLSVHANPEHFKCHLCQHNFRIPAACPHCHGNKLKSIGVGTQQIEDNLKKYFQKNTQNKSIQVYRFDSDSMKNISSKKLALENLESADIIIGTKMITTGFDFEKIGLIAVLLVEGELGHPSYDAHEQAYSNLRQLIGRGNRKSQKTEILLQTFIPQNNLIQALCEHNFKDFLSLSLKERKDFAYPPFSEMISFDYRHKDAVKSVNYVQQLAESLKSYPEAEKLAFLPSSSAFRKHNMYHAKLIIKGENIRSLLSHIEKKILSNSQLSLIFHE